MASLEMRVVALEQAAEFGGDGRCPGLVDFMRDHAERAGTAFDISSVPRGVTLQEVLKSISGMPGSRGIDLVKANEAKRRTPPA